MANVLYFIALVPPQEIEEEVKSLKEEIKEKYHSQKALKLPAHITLQKPFHMTEEDEPKLLRAMERAIKAQDEFTIKLKDFGAFPPRVIYVAVENEDSVKTLYENLAEELKKTSLLSEKEVMSKLHPHITIATRDLGKKQFHKAWEEFRNRHFQSIFTADELTLFKHNGKSWDVLKVLKFPSS